MHDADDLDDAQWLDAFVAQWHVLADLSFSDLLLWRPVDEDGDEFVCTNQIRPVTGPTAIEHDIVGERIASDEPDHPVVVAWLSGEPAETTR